MSSQRDSVDYLRDILDAAESAEQFVGTMGAKDFASDKKTVFAVVRALEIVGEATKRIPDMIRQQYPEIPWRAMAGMRDKLSHDYISVDTVRVFETVRSDLPLLRTGVVRILQDLTRADEHDAP